MEIDYRIPFQFNAITLEEVPITNNSNSGKAVMPMEYSARIKWSDIEAVQLFYKLWFFPQDQRPKSILITKRGITHIVLWEYEDVARAWEDYCLWAERKSMFKFN